MFIRGMALLPVTGAVVGAGAGSAGWKGFGAGGKGLVDISATLAGS